MLNYSYQAQSTGLDAENLEVGQGLCRDSDALLSLQLFEQNFVTVYDCWVHKSL